MLTKKIFDVADAEFGKKVINMENKMKSTAVFEVCIRGYKFKHSLGEALDKRHTIIKSACQLGADINQAHHATKMTPLHWACYHRDKEAV